MRLLIVEDDDRGGRYLVRGLSESGHIADRAADGEMGLALALEGIYDVLIVDRRLPGLDGIALVTQLRKQGIATPVLMLSAIANTPDRVAGLHAGCNDYLAKPYAFAEVLARVEGLARRADKTQGQAVLRTGRSDARHPGAQGVARRPCHRPAAPGVLAAGAAHAGRRTGRHAVDAAGGRLGLRFRTTWQHH